jgi:glyoxalase family protein
MASTIHGLHHVTATATDAREDLAFYTGVLGLRLVKKTVNFDNPGVYHFYYGDEAGAPSTLMTTFPYGGQGVRVGSKGAGQITVVSFSVPRGSLGVWQDRLAAKGVGFQVPGDRFGERALMIEDPSGLYLELREGDGDARPPWVAEGIDPGAAIRGLHGVTFLVHDSIASLGFLTDVLGFGVADRFESRVRLTTGEGGPGTYVEVVEVPGAPAAVNGLGTVHHVAMAVADASEQLAIREDLVRRGHQVTEVRDRQYFQSIYFREPGGVLYEIATAGPGFTLDESVEELGRGLKLPPWEEPNRTAIEAALPSVSPRVARHG